LTHSSVRASSWFPASRVRATMRCGTSWGPKSTIVLQGGATRRDGVPPSTVSSIADTGPLTAICTGNGPEMSPKNSVRKEIVMGLSASYFSCNTAPRETRSAERPRSEEHRPRRQPQRRDQAAPDEARRAIEQVQSIRLQRQPDGDEGLRVELGRAALAVDQQKPAAVLIDAGAQPLAAAQLGNAGDPGVLDRLGEHAPGRVRRGQEEERERLDLLPEGGRAVGENPAPGRVELHVEARHQEANGEALVE